MLLAEDSREPSYTPKELSGLDSAWLNPPSLYLSGLYHPCETPLHSHLRAALGSGSGPQMLEEQCSLKASRVGQQKSARAP